MAAAKSGGAAKTASAPTEDRSGDTHKLDNAGADRVSGDRTPDERAGDTGDNPSADEIEARESAAAARNVQPPQVEAELTHGVDPITGGEKSIEDALHDRVPVMVPESKGDIRTDVTWPAHVQAPPAAQVAGEQSKVNSSTRQRVAAQRDAQEQADREAAEAARAEKAERVAREQETASA